MRVAVQLGAAGKGQRAGHLLAGRDSKLHHMPAQLLADDISGGASLWEAHNTTSGRCAKALEAMLQHAVKA